MKTDVEVFCQECGKSLGYVVEDGHKEWWCEAHSANGEVSTEPAATPDPDGEA
jgi:peptide methionine sulfoxide reductase MsrB